ncbi:MAG: hypothetical protein O7E57_09615 [Gammaproteobacteria bacterium]|nr:hypothetical protein [Gammaproteobacteria bacterium]
MTDHQPEQGSPVRRSDSGGNSSFVTLENLQKIARFLTPLKWVSIFAFVIFAVTFIFSVVEAHLDRYTIPSVVGGMWAMLLFAFITGFQVIPAHAPAEASMTERMTTQIARAAYWLLAALTGTASLGALVITFRLLVIWSSEHGA